MSATPSAPGATPTPSRTASRADADADTTGDATTPALRLHGVSKRFGAVPAVTDLDLAVAPGSLTALLGPSGCGKTTALRLVAGLERPDAGTIAVGPDVVAGPGTFVAPHRRRVGLVFQDYALFPHLDVATNVAYGLSRLSADEVSRRVDEALDLVGLSHQRDRRPDQLSGGQQQRVALARALAPRPSVLLLDEPFSNLDAALRVVVREEVRTILRATGTTAVFVTHDQTEALSLADRVAVMRDGRLHQVAAPHELYARPATRFVAEFVGDALAVPATRAGRFFVDTPLGRLETVRPVGDGPQVVLVRPEEVEVRRGLSPAAARIVGVTYYGHDQVVTVEVAGLRLRARLGPTRHFAVDDPVSVVVNGPVAAFPAGDDDPRPIVAETTPTTRAP